LGPESIEGLLVVITADQYGRPPKPRELAESVQALRSRAAALHVQSHAPKPILMGRHLIELGLPPGPQFGEILDAAYEAQLEGRLSSLADAWLWLAERPDLDLPPEARTRLESRP